MQNMLASLFLPSSVQAEIQVGPIYELLNNKNAL